MQVLLAFILDLVCQLGCQTAADFSDISEDVIPSQNSHEEVKY
jgi:hypothetical protein